MKTFIIARRTFLAAALAFAGISASAAEDNSSTLKFSDPSKPGTFKIALARGDVRINGTDTAEVSVKSDSQQPQRPRKDGLRVLTASSSYELSEKDNVITLNAGADGFMGSPSDFQITVPRGTNVIIANALGGDITCSGLAGDIEVKSLHGEVRLDDVVGGAVVETMNGEISATIRQLQPEKALSFMTMNGEVQLRLAADAKANVKLRTQNGTILTDFDEKSLVTKVQNMGGSRRNSRHGLSPEIREAVREATRAGIQAAREAAEAVREAAEVAREELGEAHGDGADPDVADSADVPTPPMPPMPPSIPTVTGGKLVTGALNGGGPEITVNTMNGDVTLRRLSATP